MAKKFILQGDSLRLSASVEFHCELVSKPNKSRMPPYQTSDPEIVKGGGWWHVDDKEKFALLYSSSNDFGPVSIDLLLKACHKTHFSARWIDYKVYYSVKDKLEEALKDKVLIYKIENYATNRYR